MLWHVILGLLRDDRLHHGYELLLAYRTRSGSGGNPGNFYRELARLHAQGYIETGPNPPEVDSRRIPYRVTDRGRAAFDRWLLSPPVSDSELSGWVLFVGRVQPATRDEVLAAWEEHLWSRSQEQARQHRATAEAPPDAQESAPEYRSLRLLSARHLKHLEADLAFLAELRADLRTWQQEELAPDPTAGTRPPARHRRGS